MPSPSREELIGLGAEPFAAGVAAKLPFVRATDLARLDKYFGEGPRNQRHKDVELGVRLITEGLPSIDVGTGRDTREPLHRAARLRVLAETAAKYGLKLVPAEEPVSPDESEAVIEGEPKR